MGAGRIKPQLIKGVSSRSQQVSSLEIDRQELFMCKSVKNVLF